MSKIIKTGSNSRTKLLDGATQLAKAVVATLGPRVVTTALASFSTPLNNFVLESEPVLIILLIFIYFLIIPNISFSLTTIYVSFSTTTT